MHAGEGLPERTERSEIPSRQVRAPRGDGKRALRRARGKEASGEQSDASIESERNEKDLTQVTSQDQECDFCLRVRRCLQPGEAALVEDESQAESISQGGAEIEEGDGESQEEDSEPSIK